MTQEISNALPTLLRDLLLETASSEGLDCNQARRMLWAMVAPSTLNDLPEVLSKLARMLRTAESQWPGTLAASDLMAWPSIISRLKPIAEGFKYPKTPPTRRHLGIVVATTPVTGNVMPSIPLCLPCLTRNRNRNTLPSAIS
jgi:hypothetical protein